MIMNNLIKNIEEKKYQLEKRKTKKILISPKLSIIKVAVFLKHLKIWTKIYSDPNTIKIQTNWQARVKYNNNLDMSVPMNDMAMFIGASSKLFSFSYRKVCDGQTTWLLYTWKHPWHNKFDKKNKMRWNEQKQIPKQLKIQIILTKILPK